MKTFFSLFLVLLSIKAYSADWYVNDLSTDNDVFTTGYGNDSQTGGVADPFRSIYQALSVASAGDNIYIDAGIYNYDGGFAGCDCNLNVSLDGLSFIGAGADVTIVDHNYGGTASDYFMYITGNNVTLSGMQIREFENNGTQTPGHSGQAVTIQNATGVLFDHVYFADNGMSGGNPAISVLSNSTVTLNGGGSTCNVWATAWTGGVETWGTNITLNMNDYIIAFNHKENSFNGGGFYMSAPDADTDEPTNITVNMTNVRITTNHAANGGAVMQEVGTLNMTDCVIENCQAGQTSSVVYGAGIALRGGDLNLTRCIFRDNINKAGSVYGGAIGIYTSVMGSNVTIDNCLFENSNYSHRGTDMFVDRVEGPLNITVTNTTFSSNASAIYNKDPSSFTFSNSGTPSITNSNTGVSFIDNNAPTSVPAEIARDFVGDCNATDNSFPMPIELISFDGQYKDESTVALNWKVASQFNNDYFTIEYSNNGIDWDLIGRVHGEGTTNQYMEYNLAHHNVHSPKNYYRLTQYDFDGSSETFNIISVNAQHEARTIVAITNLYGQKVSPEYKGVVIIQYSNGDVVKKAQ